MINIKQFWSGRSPTEIYGQMTKWRWIKYRFRSFIRKTFKFSLVVSVVGGLGYSLGTVQNKSNDIAIATTEKIVEVEIPRAIPPVMARIAQCESGNSHYDKNGQVIINATKDAGKYQVNVPIWGKKATEFGLNLMAEKDNEQFAIWLYENYGTEPWSLSKNCWNK